ncbi:hypothetical protein DY000_02037644, partial [Brassica cretica]
KVNICETAVIWDLSTVIWDFVKAFDEAIKDGVDVLSVSIGVGGPPFRPFNVNAIEQDLEIGSFHAMTKGIPVTAGAGNSGSEAYTIAYSSPTVRINVGKTFVGRPKSTTVAGFSCRGPRCTPSPAILKVFLFFLFWNLDCRFNKADMLTLQPDIVAPGVWLLSADINDNQEYQSDFAITQGTSVATPVVAGIVVLLKSLHPDWSPAALKSAIMTTAWKTDPFGEPIFAEGLPRKLADPFDYGAGLVNAERAKDPGLVYDMNLGDYIFYFFASGYNDTAITPSRFQTFKGEVTVTRTVTNVGPVDSVYRAVVEAPEGVKIAVEPETLVFNNSTKKLGFSPVSASLALSQAVCACPMVACLPWVLESFVAVSSVFCAWSVVPALLLVSGGVSIWRVGSSDESGAICQVEDLLTVRCSCLGAVQFGAEGYVSLRLFFATVKRPEDTLVATGFSPVKRSDLRCIVLRPAVWFGGWTCFCSLVWLSSSHVLVVCPYWRPILVSFGCLLVSLRWF